MAPRGREAARTRAGSCPVPMAMREGGISVTETGSADVAQRLEHQAWGELGLGTEWHGGRQAQERWLRGRTGTGTSGCGHSVAGLAAWLGGDMGPVWWVGGGGSPTSFSCRLQRQQGGMAAGGCCEAAPQPQNPILDAQLHRLCGRRALLGGGCIPSLGSALGGIGAAARRGRQELCCPPQTYHSGVGWTLENVPGHEAEVPASSQHLHRPWRREQIHRRRR